MKKVLSSLLILCMVLISSVAFAGSSEVPTEVIDFIKEYESILTEYNVTISCIGKVEYLLPDENTKETEYITTPSEGATVTIKQVGESLASYSIIIDISNSNAQKDWRHCARALLIAGCDLSADHADYLIQGLYDNQAYLDDDTTACYTRVDDYTISLLMSDTTLGMSIKFK